MTEKDKKETIVQYLSELSPSKAIVLLVRNKEYIMGVADFLLEVGYPLVAIMKDVLHHKMLKYGIVSPRKDIP